jgi:hypothetical protein
MESSRIVTNLEGIKGEYQMGNTPHIYIEALDVKDIINGKCFLLNP